MLTKHLFTQIKKMLSRNPLRIPKETHGELAYKLTSWLNNSTVAYGCGAMLFLSSNPNKAKNRTFYKILTIKQKINIKGLKSTDSDPFFAQRLGCSSRSAHLLREGDGRGCGGIPWFHAARCERKQGRVGGAKQMMMAKTHPYKDKLDSKTADRQNLRVRTTTQLKSREINIASALNLCSKN